MTPATPLPIGFNDSSPLSRAEKILVGMLAIAVILVIGLFIGLSFFDYPSADDFCYAAKVNQLGFFGAQAFWYENWSGRYTLNLAWTALMMSGDIFKIYRYPPILLLVSTWFSFSFLTAKIARGSLSGFFIFLSGGIWTLLFISGVPDPAQTFYWIGGSFTYQLPNIFLIFLLGLLIWRETTAKDERSRTLIFVLSSLLVVATIGVNEISLLLTLTVLGGGTLYALGMRRDSRRFWIALLVIGIGATLVSVLAPGNYQRYVSIEHDTMLRPTPWLAAFLYLPWVALRLLYWLSNLGLWAAAFILLVFTFPAARARLYIDGKFAKLFLVFPVLWISLIFVLNAVGFLINRYPLPERAESVLYLLFLLGWFPSFIILVHFLVGDKFQFGDRRSIAPAAALLFISVLGTPNVFEAYKDVYRGYRYAQEIRTRIDVIQAAKDRGEKAITVDSLSRPPRTLFATDIATDPNNFRNKCTSEYYELESIRLGSPMKP